VRWVAVNILEEFFPAWSRRWRQWWAQQALRGVDLNALTIVTGIGDVPRFENQRQFMGYLALVSGEHSTCDTVRRGGSPLHRLLPADLRWLAHRGAQDGRQTPGSQAQAIGPRRADGSCKRR
jgi:hypothetical protein